MHRAAYLILISTLICTLFSAGCLTQSPSLAEEAGIRLLSPAEGIPLYDGQGHYAGIIGKDSLDIVRNYGMGLVTLEPGNATPLHRLLGTSEMAYLLQGAAEIHCDNVTVSVRKGELVILPEGVLQSIAAVGDTRLQYINVVQPPFSYGIEVLGTDLLVCSTWTDDVPIIIPDSRAGIEWDIGSDMMIYTLANPILMPEANFPIDYSIAYAELFPGGVADINWITGASEVIYVIQGEIEVFTPDGTVITVPAGSAAYIAPGQKKGYRNAGSVQATMLSIVDPAWTPERTVWAT